MLSAELSTLIGERARSFDALPHVDVGAGDGALVMVDGGLVIVLGLLLRFPGPSASMGFDGLAMLAGSAMGDTEDIALGSLLWDFRALLDGAAGVDVAPALAPLFR